MTLDARGRHAAVAALLLLAALGIFLLRAWRILPFTMDDAFITFRYAQHVAQGEGPTWNVGENPPTEGCTSFLWLGVMSFATFLHADMEWTAKSLGIASILITAGLVFLAIRRSVKGPEIEASRLPAACAGSAVFLLNAHLPAHAVSGMETALALMLLTALSVVVGGYLRRPGTSGAWGAGLAALLLGLSRPEMNLAAGVILGAAIVLSTDRSRLVVCGVLPWLVLGGIYFVWRWWYFGLPFPLPFYVKQVGHGLLAGFRPTAAYVVFLWPLGPFLLLFLIRAIRMHREWLPALLGAAAVVLYFIFPAHIMGSDYRFPFPTYGVVAIFAGLGAAPLIGRLSWRRPGVLCGLVTILAVFAVQQQLRFRLVRSVALTEARGHETAFVPLASALAALDPSGRHTLAISDAGAVPYLSGWRTIDTFGLNDREIALHLWAGYDPERVLSAQPDLLVLISNSGDVFEPPLPFERLLYDACASRGYRRLGVLHYAEGYHLWLMARDEDTAAALRAALIPRAEAFSQ